MRINWFFIWINLNPLHPRMLCAKFGWNWPSGSGEEDFLISSTYFRYFVIISPWKRAGPFIWTNLNPLYPRMLCAKFGWIWPSGSWEEDKNVPSFRQRQRQRTTDKFWSEKLTWVFGSGELNKGEDLYFWTIFCEGNYMLFVSYLYLHNSNLCRCLNMRVYIKLIFLAKPLTW